MTAPTIPQIISRAEAKALGLRRYFTGKPCKHGHVAERLVSTWQCMGCQQRRYVTPERREYARRYRASHKQQIREYNRKYDASPRAKQALKAWKDRNREHLRKWYRAYKKTIKEKVNADTRNRRARQRAAGGTHTAADIADILRLQKRRCAWCRAKLNAGYHVDHITALARGGTNDRRNLQALCPSCNYDKNSKCPLDFAREHGRLL